MKQQRHQTQSRHDNYEQVMWLLSTLSQPRESGARCKLGILDMILFDDGKPLLWLCTSKDGTVTRKQRMHSETIATRFQRIFNSSKKADEPAVNSPPSAVAALRLSSGAVQFLRADTLELFMGELGSVGADILSLHCLVQPRRGVLTIFRNRFIAAHANVRASTSSSCADLPSFDDSDSAVTVEINEHELRPTGNSTLNQLLDLATNNLVQYLNANVGEAIIRELVVDYVVDARSQLWMLWVHNVVLDEEDETEESDVDATVVQVVAEHKPVSEVDLTRNDNVQRRKLQERAIAASQIESASKMLGTHSKSSEPQLPFERVSLSLEAYDSKPFRSQQAFQCAGDYCHTKLHESRVLRPHTSSVTQLHDAIGHRLSDHKRMLLNAAPHPEFPVSTEDVQLKVLHKSILLARDERAMQAEDTTHFDSRSSNSLLAPTASSQSRADWKAHRDNTGIGAAAYYDEVRVCQSCYAVYQLLDWARRTLQEASLKQEQSSSPKRQQHKPPAPQQQESRPQPNTPQPKKKMTGDDKLSRTALPKSDSPTHRQVKNVAQAQPKWKTSVIKPEDDTVAFHHLDDYLRGKADQVVRAAQREQLTASEEDVTLPDFAQIMPSVYRARVLIASNDNESAEDAAKLLRESNFLVHVEREGRRAMEHLQNTKCDVVLISRDLPLLDAIRFTQTVRDMELSERRRISAAAAASGRGEKLSFQRLPIICYTDRTDAEDIRAYMKADMDGCVSIPVDATALIRTVQAAVPHHLASVGPPDNLNSPPRKSQATVHKLGAFGIPETGHSSSVAAAKSLAVSAKHSGEMSGMKAGIVQLDADTSIPYIVLEESTISGQHAADSRPFYNLVVVHDMFDTAERMRILMKPIVAAHPGLQVLLWNYPGQAFTEWRDEQLLNNEYLAGCLNEVLGQVGSNGTGEFDTSRPFHIVGYGNGANIALFYAAHYRVPSLRSLVLVNGFSFVDAHLAGCLQDCINVFSCAPPSRPDLPVYFFSRFLFSKEYLKKVSAPLALNLYTAVHNPIPLNGRIKLCQGALKHVDLRETLNQTLFPIILVHGTQDALVRPLHTDPFIVRRAGECQTIQQCLQSTEKTCILWMKSGHEVFQERRKDITTLIEQLALSFHEVNAIPLASLDAVDTQSFPDNFHTAAGNSSIEDKFIQGILSSVPQEAAPNSAHRQPQRQQQQQQSSAVHQLAKSTQMFQPQLGETDMRPSTSPAGARSELKDSRRVMQSTNTSEVILDPNAPAFERQHNAVYGVGEGSRIYPRPEEYPEVREYMVWRVKRNKKRFQRLQAATTLIQSLYRGYRARKLAHHTKCNAAALNVQRCYRGHLGRRKFLQRARSIWAAIMIQRLWRGHCGRMQVAYLLHCIAAAVEIQRIYRSYRDRQFVRRLVARREEAASKIQALYRRSRARIWAFRRRREMNAATAIQRLYRGHLGRRKAAFERDQYTFSKSQSQGIEFGRQMLLEHKLHATKLQSDVTLLTKEKIGVEEEVEALLEEISEFEQGIRILEKEMHQLSKIEADAAAFMDEDSKFEIREQKMRLDQDFGTMLAKISDRKERLTILDSKLGTLDKARQVKEEELRVLERKLVVLLEEQQRELEAIKRRQMKRPDTANSMAITDASGQLVPFQPDGSGQLVAMGNGGGFQGPSMSEKRQAAQLLQSTETLMKFGFMSMSMTYFSSLNMIRALRTVSAQDTIMAAVAQAALGNGVNESLGSQGSTQFVPQLKPGQLPGQESLQVSAWSVEDVSKWLQTISLGEYVEAFRDAAVDGEFLYDLNDDDLKNTLGVEHRLHRKKILGCVQRLKQAEGQFDNRFSGPASLGDTGAATPLLRLGGQSRAGAPSHYPDDDLASMYSMSARKTVVTAASGTTGAGGSATTEIKSLATLMSFVRHDKLKKVKDALEYLPNKKFDTTLVRVPYVDGFGTAYIDAYEREAFHINKTDDHGNTALIVACQNKNEKMARFLIQKGANPNHQNKQGQTGGHFAIAYQALDLAAWLFDQQGGGADDTIHNVHGLTPYDGISGGDAD